MRANIIGGLLAASLLAYAPAGHAAVYAEIGDAGDLPAGAQNVGNGTTQITGTAGNSGFGDIDMFRFFWAGGALTIDAPALFPLDPILYLFSATGLGIAGNDDRTLLDTAAELTFAALAAGEYFVSVGHCCNQPQSAGGAIFPNVVLAGQFLPTGPGGAQPITGWGAITTEPSVTAYEINFSASVDAGGVGNAIPEPASLTLLGLLGLGLTQARRRA